MAIMSLPTLGLGVKIASGCANFVSPARLSADATDLRVAASEVLWSATTTITVGVCATWRLVRLAQADPIIAIDTNVSTTTFFILLSLIGTMGETYNVIQSRMTFIIITILSNRKYTNQWFQIIFHNESWGGVVSVVGNNDNPLWEGEVVTSSKMLIFLPESLGGDFCDRVATSLQKK